MKLQYDLWEESYRTGNTPWRTDKGLEEWINKSGISSGLALDLGCGTGEQAIWLAKHGFEVEALDYSGEALKIARKAAGEHSLDIKFIEWDLENLKDYSFTHDKYDLIVCQKVIAFLDRRDQFLEAVAPRLGGVLILRVFLAHDEAPHIVSDESELTTMLNKHFSLREKVMVPNREGVVVADYYLTPKS